MKTEKVVCEVVIKSVPPINTKMTVRLFRQFHPYHRIDGLEIGKEYTLHSQFGRHDTVHSFLINDKGKQIESSEFLHVYACEVYADGIAQWTNSLSKQVIGKEQQKIITCDLPEIAECNFKPILTRDQHRKMITRAEITYAFTGDWLLSLQIAERAYLEIISMGILK